LQRIYRKFKRQDFEILGLDSETLGQKNVEADFLRQSQSNAHLIVTSRGVNWPQSPNETSVPIAQRFGFETLPAKILIDRDGLFVKRINKISELEALLDSLLKTKP
jgi:glutathione peroxidase-family protein